LSQNNISSESLLEVSHPVEIGAPRTESIIGAIGSSSSLTPLPLFPGESQTVAEWPVSLLCPLGTPGTIGLSSSIDTAPADSSTTLQPSTSEESTLLLKIHGTYSTLHFSSTLVFVLLSPDIFD